MPQEQSVIISPQSAFIFQCPWFIQCAGSHALIPPLPPPALNDKGSSLQISANWIRDGWGCSHTCGEVYTPLLLEKSPSRLRKRQEHYDGQEGGNEGRQTVRQFWQCVLAVPHPPLGSPGCLWMSPMAAAAHLALHQCADWLSSLHGMGMLYALHIPLSLAGSICCLLSLSFLHKSTVWMIRWPRLTVSPVCACCGSSMKAKKPQKIVTCIYKVERETHNLMLLSALFCS